MIRKAEDGERKDKKEEWENKKGKSKIEPAISETQACYAMKDRTMMPLALCCCLPTVKNPFRNDISNYLSCTCTIKTPQQKKAAFLQRSFFVSDA